jgi:hypothetical protein
VAARIDVVPVLFQPAGGVQLRPATLSANKTAEQIRKREHDRMHQLSGDLRTGGEVPWGLVSDIGIIGSH